MAGPPGCGWTEAITVAVGVPASLVGPVVFLQPGCLGALLVFGSR